LENVFGKDKHMAIDPRKRQKQLEKKAAKRKAVQAARKDALTGGLLSAARKVVVAGASPIYECLVPERLGIGNVIVSRKMPSGEIGASFFLVDVYCLGIKFAFFLTMDHSEYLRKVASLSQYETFVKTDPACARKLVEDAEAYAKENGFPPHPHYLPASKIFGDVDSTECSAEFTFGKDGKPYFFAGPKDTPAKCKKIMDTLLKRFGPDGFHFMAPLEAAGLDRES
jgi:hypothetical protein